ncbi:MAG TPA: succinate--CoA ligase subunit alpha [Chloroflexota bacterium]|jgi:succinyl-CoA synthetase alpha subunit|nr:succinate--CoA ligase subunit alpha [Chloroflexota bacterium]
MAILVGPETRLLVQGITGRNGTFHTRQMLDYGTSVVAGVVGGRGGSSVHGVPVYDTVRDAVAETGATTSIIFVPPPFAADAIMEAGANGLGLIVCITEGIPVHDMVRVVRFLADYPGTRLIGPNCPGVITPGAAKVGIMPGNAFAPGRIGVISRSGTLTYETADLLSKAGFGQSTCVGIGGDPVIGSTFVDILKLFQQDVGTDLIVMIGEIGGSDEEDAAAYIGSLPAGERKPVVTFISGRSAPPGKRMGHAGAIISGGLGGPEQKVAAFRDRGLPVADAIPQIVDLVRAHLPTR